MQAHVIARSSFFPLPPHFTAPLFAALMGVDAFTTIYALSNLDLNEGNAFAAWMFSQGVDVFLATKLFGTITVLTGAWVMRKWRWTPHYMTAVSAFMALICINNIIRITLETFA